MHSYCPAHVVGLNDHSPYGYFLRLYVNRLLPPFSWAPDTVHSAVHVMDLAEGISLAAEKGQLGETYILAGESTTLRQVVGIWAMQPGGFRIRFFVPFWLAALAGTLCLHLARNRFEQQIVIELLERQSPARAGLDTSPGTRDVVINLGRRT